MTRWLGFYVRKSDPDQLFEVWRDPDGLWLEAADGSDAGYISAAILRRRFKPIYD